MNYMIPISFPFQSMISEAAPMMYNRRDSDNGSDRSAQFQNTAHSDTNEQNQYNRSRLIEFGDQRSPLDENIINDTNPIDDCVQNVIIHGKAQVQAP